MRSQVPALASCTTGRYRRFLLKAPYWLPLLRPPASAAGVRLRTGALLRRAARGGARRRARRGGEPLRRLLRLAASGLALLLQRVFLFARRPARD